MQYTHKVMNLVELIEWQRLLATILNVTYQLELGNCPHTCRLRTIVRCCDVRGPSALRIAAPVFEAHSMGRALNGYQ